ncbi:(2Fe-2S)-binding protein [Corallincola platygyrae]|uniref:Bacterioferritin-associated ferredoxin n=1 Tax=Corallincola platygyrae TaxID=1193278 RepID=A0ABW4XQC9_9GAMM
MFVCICHGITDTQLKQAVADGAERLADVKRSLGVATQCGNCACKAKQVIQVALDDQAEALYVSAA